MRNESRHKAIGDPVSGHQKFIESLTKEEAIIRSHKTDYKKLLDLHNLPDYICKQVEAEGLTEKLKSMPKMLIQPKKGIKPGDAICNFVRNYNNGFRLKRDGEMMQPMTVKFKK